MYWLTLRIFYCFVFVSHVEVRFDISVIKELNEWMNEFTLKYRKLLILPTPSLFDGPLGGEPLRISGWNLPHKNYGDGATVWWKFHDPNFNCFSMIHPSDGEMDGQAIAYTRYSIYAVMHKKRTSSLERQ